MNSDAENLCIGWATADITPDRPVLLAGQFHARVSEGVMDPVSATALAIQSGPGTDTRDTVIMVSCDLATISNELRDAVRERIASMPGAPDPKSLFLGATHTHSAPDARLLPYGMEACRGQYKHEVLAGHYSVEQARYGMWPFLDLDIMPPSEYLAFAAERITGAVMTAWERRAPGGIAYGMGHAVVGRNRRLTYRDGTSRMYGKAQDPDFLHVEGYEDHTVRVLLTYDRGETLTGMVVNVPCPSQVSEQIYRISADYWHETREVLRQRYGKALQVLAQCAPAGDQSPHVLIGKRAEERMWRLKGLAADQNAPRADIARQITAAIEDMVPYVAREIDWKPAFAHVVTKLDLQRRMITEKDVTDALEEAQPYKEQFQELMEEIANNPEIRKRPRWYKDITRAYRHMERGARVRKRFELQQEQPTLPIETHAVRLGDVALATNPFELYLDYALRIQERSAAIQTFLVQKAGCSGTYLPSARSIAHQGYGSVPASTDVGPEGGDQLVEWTIATIKDLWQEKENQQE